MEQIQKLRSRVVELCQLLKDLQSEPKETKTKSILLKLETKIGEIKGGGQLSS